VLVVDDDPGVGRAIRRDLRRHHFGVVGIAENGIRAIEMAKEENPDVITMDIRMPAMDGIDATKAIVKADPEAKIVVVTAYGAAETLYDSLAAGARGFLTKPFSDDELASTVLGVYQGELLVEAGLAASTQFNFFLEFRAPEVSVLQYLARNLSLQEIAEAMSIPIEDVMAIQDRVVEKIRLRNLMASRP
jgi:two-component system chemotaxis response regulator CheY